MRKTYLTDWIVVQAEDGTLAAVEEKYDGTKERINQKGGKIVALVAAREREDAVDYARFIVDGGMFK